ncbi:MAG: pyrroline-5-carboxylate reductase [bacterium]
MSEARIGIIGFGNMGSAIAQGIKKHYNVLAFDKDAAKTRNITGIKVCGTIEELVNNTDVVILAVKPQDFDSVLQEIRNYSKGKLIVSIAAGITTGYIEKALGEVSVVRVMPNIGAKIGQAVSSLCNGKFAKQQDLDFTVELFNCIGKTWVIKEEMIDAATAISGSGPAYIFYDMEIKKIDPLHISVKLENEYINLLREAAERVGIDSQTAYDLSVSTTASSLRLSAVSAEKHILPAELKKLVTSEGGTTAAALKVLAEGGSWQDAAEAALKRAKELSKE